MDLNNAVNIDSGKAVDVNGNGRIDRADVLSATGGGSNGSDNNPSADGITDGHPTSVAGVAVGVGNNNLGTSGIAFKSRILSSRIFDVSGSATTDANIASAVYYAAGRSRDRLSTFRSGDIMNNSWGGGSFITVIPSAFQWASSSGRNGLGTATFISGGNDFSSSVAFPSNLAGGISGVIATRVPSR